MPEYLATVLGTNGRKTTESVEADSADEAVRILREQGFEEIVLHTDDFGARYINQRKIEQNFSPRDFVLVRNLPPGFGLFLILAVKLYRKLAVWMILLVLVQGFRMSSGVAASSMDWLCMGMLAFPAVFALVVGLFSRAASYRSMMYALHRGRWEEVLSRADALAGASGPGTARRSLELGGAVRR